MSKIIASACISAILLASANLSFAREGARSVGGGIKCYYNTTLQQQVCYKSI